MEDADFDPSSSSSSRLGSLFASSNSKADKSLLRYNGEKEKKDVVVKNALEDPAPMREKDKPIFACAASAKKINNGNVLFGGKLGIALVKSLQNVYELYLYRDAKNVLWRQRLNPETEFEILGSCDVILEESKSPLSIWKVKFVDYRERTDFLVKVVQCRVEMSSLAPLSGPIKQKVGIGLEEQKLNITDSLRLGLKEYGKEHIAHIEKNLGDWSLGQSLFADEGIGCSFIISCWKEECEELSVASGSLVLLTVEAAEATAGSSKPLQRSNSDDQPDGQKLREVQSLETKPTVRERLSNVGRPTPFLSAGNINVEPAPQRSGSSLSLQEDRTTGVHTPVHRKKMAPETSGLERASAATPTTSDLGQVNLKLDAILKAVTDHHCSARGMPAMQKIGPFDPTIVMSSVMQLVEQNQSLREELKEKSAKIENLSDKMADLAMSLRMTPVLQIPPNLQSEIEELKNVNKRLNEELEQANYDYRKVDDELYEAGTRVKELEKEGQEKQTRMEELQSQIKSLQALLRTAEVDSLAKVKAEAERRQAVEADLKETRLLAETAISSRDKLAVHVVEVHKKHAAELKKAREESNEKVKKIMNMVYKKVNKNFQPGPKYSSDDIKAAVKESIREVTMSLIDVDTTSSSSGSSLNTPQKEAKAPPQDRPSEKAFNPPRDERKMGSPTGERKKGSEVSNQKREPIATSTLPEPRLPPEKVEPTPRTAKLQFMPPVQKTESTLPNPNMESVPSLPKTGPLPEIQGNPSPVNNTETTRKPLEIDPAGKNRASEQEEEGYDIPPVRREDNDSDSFTPLNKQELFGDGLGHVETPPCLPTPSMVSFSNSDRPEVMSPKRTLERSRGVEIDDPSQNSVDESGVAENKPESKEKSDSNLESDRSAELREAIQSTINHGAHSYTPEPPPPPEFTVDSDSESDWVTSGISSANPSTAAFEW